MSQKKHNITYRGIDFDDFELLQKTFLHDLKSSHCITVSYLALIEYTIENEPTPDSEQFFDYLMSVNQAIDRTNQILDDIKTVAQVIDQDED
jgi:hypothetical protein